MKILDLKDLKNYQDNSVVTLGFFDGVHAAHQLIINRLVNEARDNNMRSVIITFEDEILNLFKVTNNIQTLNQKLECFEKLGVDIILILKASDNFMGLSALDFKLNCLDRLNTKIVVCGSDFSFARKKEGNIEFIKNNTDYKLIEIEDYYLDNNKVSSTYIRNLLNNGNIALANKLLFTPFTITSNVIEGLKIGRTIGFKTANLLINNQCRLLKHGVYFGLVNIQGKEYKTMVNVGLNPTVNNSEELKVEAHIVNFDQDLYYTQITIKFLYFQREERKFSSIDELKNRLNIDINDLNNMIFK